MPRKPLGSMLGARAALAGPLALTLLGCAVTAPPGSGPSPPPTRGTSASVLPPGDDVAPPVEEGATDGTVAGGGAAAEETEETEEPKFPISGWSSTYLRYRKTDDVDDFDVVETLSLDVGDPERSPVTGHLLMYGAADWERSVDDGSEGDFSDIDDTSDSTVVARLYDAYVDVHSIESLEALRLGRQNLYDTPLLAFFDGAWIETAESENRQTSLGAYLGRSVHFFEGAVDGDQVAGAYAQGVPWRAGRVRFDYMHLEDDTRLTEEREDLWSIRAWQRLGDELRLSAGHTRLDGEERDWFGRVHWFDPDHDLGIQLNYYELLETQGELAYELDPYYSLLFELNPYRQGQVQVSKGFGEHVVLEGGVSARRVVEDQDEGEFNREYDEQHLTLNLSDLPGDLDLALTGTVFDDSGTEIETFGADLNRDFGDSWAGSLGTYYSLYEIDLFQGRERDHARVWYVRARSRGKDSLSLDFRIEYEEDEFDDYLVTRVGAKWSF